MESNTADISLFEQIQNGNEKAYENLFRQFYSPLSLYAMKYVKEQTQAEEIVQDLFCTIWEKRNHLKLSTSLKSYLFGAIRNNCLHHLKKQKVRTNYQSEVIATQGKHSPYDDRDSLEQQETADRIQSSIDKLPEQRKKIFLMSRYEGLKYQEIADKLQLSIKTVEAQMSKALKSLRADLNDLIPTLLIWFFFW